MRSLSLDASLIPVPHRIVVTDENGDTVAESSATMTVDSVPEAQNALREAFIAEGISNPTIQILPL